MVGADLRAAGFAFGRAGGVGEEELLRGDRFAGALTAAFVVFRFFFFALFFFLLGFVAGSAVADFAFPGRALRRRFRIRDLRLDFDVVALGGLVAVIGATVVTLFAWLVRLVPDHG